MVLLLQADFLATSLVFTITDWSLLGLPTAVLRALPWTHTV